MTLYWVRPRNKMIVARFEFKPEHAPSFIQDGASGQSVLEMTFESVESLIEATKEFERALVDCTAMINGKIILLSSFKAK